jgi:hypothetical protein
MKTSNTVAIRRERLVECFVERFFGRFTINRLRWKIRRNFAYRTLAAS